MIGTGRKRAVLIGICDALIVVFSALLSLGLRFNFDIIPSEYLIPAIYCLPIDILIAILVLRFFRLYNRVWTYASMEESMSILEATICIEIIYVLYHYFFQILMPRSFYIFDAILLFLMFLTSRFARRIQKQLFSEKSDEELKKEPYS